MPPQTQGPLHPSVMRTPNGAPVMSNGQMVRVKPNGGKGIGAAPPAIEPQMGMTKDMRRDLRAEMRDRGMPTWGQEGFDRADRREVRNDMFGDTPEERRAAVTKALLGQRVRGMGF